MINRFLRLFKDSVPTSTHSIQGRKPSQQDAYLVSESVENKRLILVADGVGGHAHGDFASQTAIEIFKQEFDGFVKRTDGFIPDFLQQTTMLLAATVLNKSNVEPEFKNCGTTVSAAFIEADEFFTLNVGDSRVYHYANNSLRRMTKDHSKVQRLIDANLLTEQEAANHPERSLMTSAIGQPIETLKIDINGPYTLTDNDIILVISDGVHDSLNDEQIANLVEQNKHSSKLAQIIVEQAYKAGSSDNITTCTYTHKI